MEPTPETPPVSVGEHTLGPHVVGQRVVVRRLLPGQVGPSGGPAMTDVLGVCRSWARGLCEVETAEGTVVAIHIGDIVSGKPVPPRPSVRLRTSPREAHLHGSAMWPVGTRRDLGDWVLRAAGQVPDAQHPQGRLVRRANSALAMGDPGVPLPEAAAAVADFYREVGQPALAQVVVDSDLERALGDLGWAGNDSGISLLQVAPLSRALRALRANLGATVGPEAGVTLRERAAAPGGTSALSGAVHHATVSIADQASVQVTVDADWAGINDLWVSPARRRQGLARALLAEAFDWAASLGAATAHLQVSEASTAALQLYATAGFSTHHSYRYLLAP